MRVKVKVFPNKKEEKVIEGEGTYLVYLTERPIKGKANRELIKVLSRYFKVSKSKIRIIKGLKSKEKTIEILI